jgi:hypothetical protein
VHVAAAHDVEPQRVAVSPFAHEPEPLLVMLCPFGPVVVRLESAPGDG